MSPFISRGTAPQSEQSHVVGVATSEFPVFNFCRKEQLSNKFHRHHLLLRCLRAWQQWVKKEQERREVQEEHDKKTQKMAALLEAAATGRLWSERGGNTSMALEDIEDDRNEQSSSTARKLVSLVFMRSFQRRNCMCHLLNCLAGARVIGRKLEPCDMCGEIRLSAPACLL